MSIKRVLIPAAGRGARLDRPRMPKPLVFVAGLPMILRTLVQCEEAGIEEAVVVVGYEAPTLVKALTLHPRLSKLKVRFAEAPRWQEEGLVASLLAARPLLGDERFVILPAPLGPSRPKTCPRARASESGPTAGTGRRSRSSARLGRPSARCSATSGS